MTTTMKQSLFGAALVAVLSTATYFVVGTGNNSLTIDGSTTKYNPGDTIKIKAGSYSSITIQNINGTASQRIVLLADGGQVNLLGNTNNTIPFAISNCTYIIIDGQKSGGFYIHDLSYRGMSVHGNPSGIILRNFLFQNIDDYSIGFDYNDAYPAVATNVKILNSEFNNAGSVNFQGNINNGSITGYVKGLEVAYCYFHDSPDVGSLVYCGNVEDYTIHHNVINAINQNSNNHNGIFMLDGNGQFYNNKVTNHQGNALRAWGVTIGTTPKQVLIYNNIVDSSRKYSGFEVQSFQSYISAGKTTYVNAQIYNNTCGDLNLTHDWIGGVVDVYNLFGGTCTVANNLAFNTYPSNTIANQQNVLVPTLKGNVYQATWKTAVMDLTTYKSLFPSVGATLSTTTTVTPAPTSTTTTNPTSTIVYDTVYIHDTVSVAGKSGGTYTLRVSKDTVIFSKQ